MLEKTGNAQVIIEWLFSQDREKLWDIKEHKEKRSLKANDYCWVLCTKIAQSMRPPLTKEEVYLKALKEYGQDIIVTLPAEVEIQGYFKYFEWLEDDLIDEQIVSRYLVYKGSSEYDSKEMSILIDGLVRDAQELGIETLPPAEIERMKQQWQ